LFIPGKPGFRLLLFAFAAIEERTGKKLVQGIVLDEFVSPSAYGKRDQETGFQQRDDDSRRQEACSFPEFLRETLFPDIQARY
jgi:hypothetical protein